MCKVFSAGCLLLAIGTGCCLETINGRASTSSGASSAGSTTGGAGTSSGGASSSGGSSTGAPFYIGAVEVETVTTIDPNGSDEPTFGSMRGQFLPANEWPACPSESLVDPESPCCFAPGNATLMGLSAGDLKVEIDLANDGVQTLFLTFDGSSQTYRADNLPVPEPGAWYSTLSALGDVVPSFTYPGAGFPPPDPVLSPGLETFQTLSTSQDWTVPLTPSEFEFQFYDRAILEVDGVGSIICQVADEGALRPPLVVPAALLANFAGQHGTITIYRDEYNGFLDAGSLLVGYRTGKAIRTSPGAVSFTE